MLNGNNGDVTGWPSDRVASYSAYIRQQCHRICTASVASYFYIWLSCCGISGSVTAAAAAFGTNSIAIRAMTAAYPPYAKCRRLPLHLSCACRGSVTAAAAAFGTNSTAIRTSGGGFGTGASSTSASLNSVTPMRVGWWFTNQGVSMRACHLLQRACMGPAVCVY